MACIPSNRVRDLHYLRNVVAWADGQREDYWYPDPGSPLPAYMVCALYDAVHYLGAELEEVTADELPAPWSGYTAEERRAINLVRTALGLPRRRR